MKNILSANHASRITHHASPGVELISLISALLFLGLSPTAHANVYATNLRLNGGITNFTLSPTGTVSISYLLNEAATAGVKIEINNGATSIRIINLTNGSPGTLRGTNVVVWDGKDGNSNAPSGGTYSISATPAAVGYNDWTQISDDANLGNYVWEPRGIAVN